MIWSVVKQTAAILYCRNCQVWGLFWDVTTEHLLSAGCLITITQSNTSVRDRWLFLWKARNHSAFLLGLHRIICQYILYKHASNSSSTEIDNATEPTWYYISKLSIFLLGIHSSCRWLNLPSKHNQRSLWYQIFRNSRFKMYSIVHMYMHSDFKK